MTCKECLNADVCGLVVRGLFENEENQRLYKVRCRFLKPKSRFVELPCAVGDTVYVLRSKTSNGKNLYLREERISHYRVFGERTFMCFDSERISVADYEWINVFLTKEEAEKALQEKNNEKV